MRTRPAPRVATWILELFCSSAEHESVTGDLLEQYQLGRGRLWYWRQVLDIVFLALFSKVARRPLVTRHRVPVGQAFAVILLIGALSAVLLSDIWPILLFGMIGFAAGILIFGLDGSRTPSPKSDAQGLAAIQSDRVHPGISISHIPVEGAVGLLFVVATGFIFGIGIPAIREVLVVTIPLGLLGAGVLVYWHKRHPREIQALDLQSKNQKGIGS